MTVYDKNMSSFIDPNDDDDDAHCSELVVCSCIRLYCYICIYYCIYCLVQIVEQFPIQSGMTELIRRTKLIFADNLVPTKNLFSF